MFRFMWKWHNKSACEMIRQITFFRVSWVPKQWTGIFKVSNTCTNLCNNMVEEKAGSRSRIPRKDSKRMSMPALWREFLGFGFSASPVFKAAGPTRKIQSSSKLRQFRKWQAEIPTYDFRYSSSMLFKTRFTLTISLAIRLLVKKMVVK